MNLENQVVSLELSKKLEELGIVQESLWYWVYHNKNDKFIWNLFQKDEDDKANKHISAFTVAELGEMLPGKLCFGVIGSGRKNFWLGTNKINEQWEIFYKLDNKHINEIFHSIFTNTEVDARAEMLIWLIENKYIIKEV